MSTVKERTCANPTRWRWISKQCHCDGCKRKSQEYHQSRYIGTKQPTPTTAEQIAKRDRRRELMVLAGKATYCPICLDFTARKSGFCCSHEPDEARL